MAYLGQVAVIEMTVLLQGDLLTLTQIERIVDFKSASNKDHATFMTNRFDQLVLHIYHTR